MAFKYDSLGQPHDTMDCPMCKGEGENINAWSGLLQACSYCLGLGQVHVAAPLLPPVQTKAAAPTEFKPDTLSTTLPKRLRDW